MAEMVVSIGDFTTSQNRVTVSSAGAIKVDGSTASTATSIGSAQVNVTTAGTRVQLGSNAALSVVVKAKATNTGLIYVGNSTVSSSNGLILWAGDAVSFDVSNTNLFYIDSSVNGEGISYSWIV